jgi:tRNA (guanine26-N2/guanine27-N2)-dimethyltransferase
MTIIIREGSADIHIKEEKIVSRKMPVFYNQDMKLNRDITIAMLKIIAMLKSTKTDNGKLRCCFPLAGSGVRAIRVLKECDNIMHAVINDVSSEAYKKIKENLEINNIEYIENVSPKKYDEDCDAFIFNTEAAALLHRSAGFDYIDIDPFGSPVPFMDAAFRRISREAFFGITATDTGALCGSYPKVCMRRYDSRPLLNENCYETGLRILIRKIQCIGMQYDKAAIPVYSYYYKHYMRVFFKIIYSKDLCDQLVKEHKYMLYCPRCLKAEYSRYNNSSCCGHQMEYAGRLYSGFLWDLKITDSISDNISKREDMEKRDLDIVKTIQKESRINSQSYYHIHEFNKKYRITHIKKRDEIMQAILKGGYCVSKTHFSKLALRTDMPVEEFAKILLSP